MGVVCLTAAIGLAHTPVGQRAWGQLSNKACPFGAGHRKLSRSDLDAAYRRASQQVRGVQPAPTQFALGFDLVRTSRNDVLSWAKDHATACTSKIDGLGMDCQVGNFDAFPQSLFAAGGGTLMLRFDMSNRLRSVTAMQSVAAPEAAVASLTRVISRLEHLAGPPQAQRGELDSAYLRRGALTQIAREYHFSDYAAEVSATHMGKLGYIALSQTYTSLTD